MASEAGPSSLATAPSYAGAWSRLQPRLDDELEEHVSSVLGFTQMTPVQSSVIPLFLSHKDVIVEAVTGSGKTLAYALPVVQMMRRRKRSDSPFKKNQIGALIICPTRELAIQVHKVIEDILLGLMPDQMEATDEVEGDDQGQVSSGVLLSVGGSTSSPADDYRRLRSEGADIVVGTPGRIEELLKRPGIDVKELEVLILDEADRLLDMGFQHSLTAILRALPKQRRSGLFSATMSDALGELVRVGLRNPVRVVVKVESKANASVPSASSNEKRMPATLENLALVMQPQHKLAQLIRLLRREVDRPDSEHPTRKAIVYFATCAQVNYFFKVLSPLSIMNGLRLYSLHGKQTPVRRRATFDAFVSAVPLKGGAAASDEEASVLFCTDVAARGLDLPNVDLVIQFDPPTDPKVFSHRCGRTARAGRHGRAVVLLHKGREESYADFLKVRKNPVRMYPYLDANLHPSDNKPEEASEVDDGAAAMHQSIRDEVRKDRALFELGMQAFVSFIQGYRKHEASFVFRERDLDLGAVAYAFGLLRLPRMPEVERWRKAQTATSIFEEEEVNMHDFAYLDKLREKQRLESKEVRRASREGDGKESHMLKHGPPSKAKQVAVAWSDQKDRKDRRQLRRDKKQRKRAFLARQGAEQDQNGHNLASGDAKALPAAQKKTQDQDNSDDDDAEDWAEEERAAKKARRDKSRADDELPVPLSFEGL